MVNNLILTGLDIVPGTGVVTSTSTITTTLYTTIYQGGYKITLSVPTHLNKRSNNILDNSSFTSGSSSTMSSTSMIVAIVVPICVVVAALILLLVWYLKVHRKKSNNHMLTKEDSSLKYETDDYNIKCSSPKHSDDNITRILEKGSSNNDEALDKYETKTFGPVKYNWVSTPASAIKSYFNRKSLYGISQGYNKSTSEFNLSVPSLPFTKAATTDLASPAYITLKPFKLFRRRDREEELDNITDHNDDNDYLPQVLTDSKDTPKRIPILSNVPIVASKSNANEDNESGNPKSNDRGHHDLVQGKSHPPPIVTPRYESKTPVVDRPLRELPSYGVKIWKVVRKYDQSLDDEMDLAMDELVTVLEEFSDGWALAQKVSAINSDTSSHGQRGFVPLLCLVEQDSSHNQSL